MKIYRMKTRQLTLGAIIAAMYAAITILLAPISYGEVQVRVAEAFTLLPILTPAAVPGLFVGCLIANIYTGSMLDIVFGSLATLTAAICTRFLRDRPVLAAFPPVLINAVVVGLVLVYGYGVKLPVWMAMGAVGMGQAVACFALGLPLIWLMKKLPAGIL